MRRRRRPRRPGLRWKSDTGHKVVVLRDGPRGGRYRVYYEPAGGWFPTHQSTGTRAQALAHAEKIKRGLIAEQLAKRWRKEAR